MWPEQNEQSQVTRNEVREVIGARVCKVLSGLNGLRLLTGKAPGGF